MNGPFTTAGQVVLVGLANGLEGAAKRIMSQSLVEVPKDTETLFRSARIRSLVTNPTGMSIEFGYGFGDEVNPKTGDTADKYAVPVHEILEARHTLPEKAKYLEDPVLEQIPLIPFELKASISSVTKNPVTAATLLYGSDHDWTRDLSPFDLGFDE